MPKEVIARVVDKFILQLEAQLADRNVTIELADEARAWLVTNGYDESMGARPMARVIQTQIKTPLADEVLFGRLKNGGVVRVVVTGDDDGEKKLGFVYPEGPAQPRLERDLVVAGRERAKASLRRARRKRASAAKRPIPTTTPARSRRASRRRSEDGRGGAPPGAPSKVVRCSGAVRRAMPPSRRLPMATRKISTLSGFGPIGSNGVLTTLRWRIER